MRGLFVLSLLLSLVCVAPARVQVLRTTLLSTTKRYAGRANSDERPGVGEGPSGCVASFGGAWVQRAAQQQRVPTTEGDGSAVPRALAPASADPPIAATAEPTAAAALGR